MVVSHPALIRQLHTSLLNSPLPGESAHQAMAHVVRKTQLQPPEGIHIRNAGVLITLFEKSPGEWYLIFIRRTSAHEQDRHAGQIAFPGGKHEPDDRDMMFTALREAEEEISIDLSGIDVLGSLSPLYITVSRYRVHPFVAYSWKRPELVGQESEVAEIIELPLDGFLAPTARINTKIRLNSGFVLQQVPAFEVEGHIIWGATAMMMNEFLWVWQDKELN